MDALSTYSVSTVNGVESSCTDLLAGQTEDVGDVCFTVIGDTLEITYSMDANWFLEEAHAWIGCDAEGYPQNRAGNPKVGQFPYASGDITGATDHSFSIDISTEFDECLGTPDCTNGNILYAMTHAAVYKEDDAGNVIQEETGWGDGDPSGARNWSTVSTLTLFDDSCGGGGGGGDCYDNETAWAYDESAAVCFSEFDCTGAEGEVCVTNPTRWGWSNGAYLPADSPVSFDLYAGAGSGGSADCVITNEDGSDRATLVGSVALTYDGSAAVVSYALDAGYLFEDTHVYVGCTELAEATQGQADYTISPGQLGSTNEYTVEDAQTTDTHTIEGLDCPDGVYTTVHAGVLFPVECPAG